MHGRRSRTAHPVTGGPRGLTMGAWGVWCTIIIGAMGVAGLGAAALYLQTGAPEWPPEGITRPGTGRAWLALGLAVVACVGSLLARQRLRRDAKPDTAVALIGTLVAALASIGVLIADIPAAGFRWDEHAYTSVYWILTAGSAFFLGISALMVGAVLVQRIVGLVDPDRMLEMDVTVVFLFFSTITAAFLLALVHYLPVVTTGEPVPGTGPAAEQEASP
ncbi:hypothetical protein FTX61_00970 [Nitriliruptoraceae bacterium ZYF776]|nr:hypothetical protein [Profundirhabdus halotolerans]